MCSALREFHFNNGGIFMKIIDLTHTIKPDMPVYPGTKKPVFRSANTLCEDGFLETRFTMNSHTGTHMDAPAHMLPEGLFVNDLEIGRFMGNAVILDFSNNAEKSIGLDFLQPYEERIRKAEFVILKTGWGRFWNSGAYFKNYPSLSAEGAMWLSEFPLKGIGVDAISIDDAESTNFPVHTIFFQKNIVLIENLSNLEGVEDEVFFLSVLPLKYEKADGSPVRAVAIEGLF